ncbi:hypothetical protein GQ43DRAFT_361011 [Delitschia confertaspora ATCC 74209]|uniref:SNF2 family N-terminal domain protein n=1 Tax=Delitschia confertaspora ATCC 74209 TaxID=1513339 RepID=A0A9P4JX51_9PLEO|nr:hypothetical protein GQ43DRAFT_361011 [Delitschia confertaspora ATCC 74209]
MQPPSAFPLTYSGEGPPTQDSTEALSKLLENIRPDEDIPKELREPTPKVMSSILMEHQKIGLAWLKRMEKSVNKGGILADDMGLGKTIQALALMLARPSEDPARKTTLIVAPLALMKQWAKEIEAHVKPEHRLNVYIYHGPGKNKEFTQLRTYDVVLTTYGTLASQWKKKQGALENDTWLSVQKKMPLVANGSHWYRVILDEAQCIKNRDANCSKAAHELHAQYRLCMTGTPMMNNIDELFPLVRFLRIKPYHEWKMFSFDISKPIKETRGDLSQRGIERVQALLKGIMLRRTKDSELDGKPIIVIPAKHTKPEDVVLSKDERELYAALETKSQLRFNRYLEKGTVNNNYASILLLLLRLRQACCHPFLIRDLGVQASTEGIAEGILLERAQELGKDTAVVNRLKVEDGFECPICFDATDNPTIFIPCGHNTCGECFQKLIEGVPDGDDNSNAKCPECRAVVSSKRITDYAHFLKVYCPERLSESERDREVAEESDSNSELESESEEEDDGLDGFIVPDDVEDDVNAPTPPRDERQDKGKRKGKGKNPSKPKKTLAELKKESLRNKAAKRRYLRRLRRNWVTSAKIEKTLELLDTIYVNDPTEKTLIFSQFTSFLDLLEVPMQDRNIPYQRYDGSMNATDRADAVADFMENCNTRVLLVSLKAGNAGLNLNKASQVIMLDPFWNPFVEDQAVDRAHRMRQEREVHVHRILAPETVEDRICALQDRKRELITTALDPKAGNSIARLGVKDLMFLFGGRR